MNMETYPTSLPLSPVPNNLALVAVSVPTKYVDSFAMSDPNIFSCINIFQIPVINNRWSKECSCYIFSHGESNVLLAARIVWSQFFSTFLVFHLKNLLLLVGTKFHTQLTKSCHRLQHPMPQQEFTMPLQSTRPLLPQFCRQEHVLTTPGWTRHTMNQEVKFHTVCLKFLQKSPKLPILLKNHNQLPFPILLI